MGVTRRSNEIESKIEFKSRKQLEIRIVNNLTILLSILILNESFSRPTFGEQYLQKKKKKGKKYNSH